MLRVLKTALTVHRVDMLLMGASVVAYLGLLAAAAR